MSKKIRTKNIYQLVCETYVMVDLFLSKFKERLLEVRLLASQLNYTTCGRLSNRLTMISHFWEDTTALYISEFFEWLFINLRDDQSRHEVPKEKFVLINKAIEELIDYLVKNIPVNSDNVVELFDLIKKVRYEVTDLQIWVGINLKSRRGPLREVIFNE